MAGDRTQMRLSSPIFQEIRRPRRAVCRGGGHNLVCSETWEAAKNAEHNAGEQAAKNGKHRSQQKHTKHTHTHELVSQILGAH